ncbi:MAG: HNH endonuclease [Proteobacteria bacterium]|nr:MAG: HNH endonuclease [Pseudomonadota bacterium]
MAREGSYISVRLRNEVASRASFCCEYCLIDELKTGLFCEVDHIIGVKHNGPTSNSNLAYACFNCNRNKGSDIASIDWDSNEIIRFYNPRSDIWAEHFRFEGFHIVATTQIGKVTATIFRFNDRNRLLERDPNSFL